MLRDLGEMLDRELRGIGIEPARATAIAETLAEHTRDMYGGQINYWAKGERYENAVRRQQMWADFNGTNYDDLARKFGMSMQQAYKEIAKARRENSARTQRGLFDASPPPATDTGKPS